MAEKNKIKSTIKLIFNPLAGRKRKFLSISHGVSAQEIQSIMEQYQMPVDLVYTKGPNHATELAKNAKKEGYEMVVVVGGDGTVNEAANGLIDSNIPLGIIPTGSFMNIARMLSVPLNIEKAVALLKIRRMRRIDVGMLTKLDGEKLSKPYYFLESSGVGMEAHVHHLIKKMEAGDFLSFFRLVKQIYQSQPYKLSITADEQTIECKTNLVSITNGPFTGSTLKVAPDAKLNDHRLSVIIYKGKKIELIRHFLNLFFTQKTKKKELEIIKAKNITIKTDPKIFVHADASLFGTTPVNYKIKPSCLQVVCGFPTSSQESSLDSRTLLDQ